MRRMEEIDLRALYRAWRTKKNLILFLDGDTLSEQLIHVKNKSKLNRYLEQMRSHGPGLLRVESLPDHHLIKYGFNTLERASFANMTNSNNLVEVRTKLLRSIAENSNLTLKSYINHPHCEAIKRRTESGQSSMSRDGSIFVYNPDVLREQFEGLMIQRGLPFNHFDGEQTTRVFQKHLQPRYAHVSHTTLKCDAMKLWVMAKQVIIDRFLQINTNVNLTTDVWNPPYGVPDFYICVTAHWIEPGTWQMMKRVIAFEDFPVPHTGSALAKTLINVFVKFKLENKFMSIILDNASNNTSAIGKLRLKYEPPMEGRFYHSRCVAHIINLCVQDGLAVKEINTIKESFKTMLKDVFKLGGKNQQRYSKICKQAGKPCLSPHWDVPTRWNSTYHMFLNPESAFSTSGRVLSIQRTKTSSRLHKECYNGALKDHLDAQERKQDKSTLETPVDFEEEVLDAEVQANEAIPLSDEEIALDAASSEGSMSGPGSGGEEAEAEPNYGYDVYNDDY
ncbi:zinc finger BED domain-containing protein RICESLEEPER 2-like protein [Tanacetum coccineum]|uniref:Zinc finger BED domain-containing protein RICESLEEPER 2-like protein n=1 Tax=Tanacetum coccineum TaxID=301880 RepID=A0ABQ5EGF2_9ASTR